MIATYDGTNHLVSAYLDGKFLGTDNKTLVFHDATPYAIGIGARDTVLVDSINAYLDDVYFGTGVATQAQVNRLWNNGRGGSPSPASFSAYITDCNGTVNVLDTATDKFLTPAINVGSGPLGVLVNASGTRAYVTNANSGTVSVIDTTPNSPTLNTVIATIAVGPEPYGIAINPAGTRVYVANNGAGNNNTVSVIDTTSNNVSTITVGFGPSGLAVNPAGTRLYVANTPESTLSVIDISNDQNVVVATVSLNGSRGASAVVVNAQGTNVYIGGPDSQLVHVLDASTNAVAAEISMPGRPSGIALTPDGTRLYAALAYNNQLVAVAGTTTNWSLQQWASLVMSRALL